MTRYEGDKRPVIVRAHDAGVHFGYLVAYEGRVVWLECAHRLWKWKANLGVALNGVAVSGLDRSGSKVDVLVPEIIILDACEIITCTPEGAASIAGTLWAK